MSSRISGRAATPGLRLRNPEVCYMIQVEQQLHSTSASWDRVCALGGADPWVPSLCLLC